MALEIYTRKPRRINPGEKRQPSTWLLRQRDDWRASKAQLTKGQAVLRNTPCMMCQLHGFCARISALSLSLHTVRHRRVVKEDAHFAVAAPLIAKRVLNPDLVVARGIDEVVGAHRDCNVT